MGSITSEKMRLENDDCSLPLSPPKHKMRKVSVVRDFPFVYSPHPTLINVHAKEAQGGRLKSVGDLFNYADSMKNECEESPELPVILPSSTLSDELINRNLNPTLILIRNREEESMSIHKTHDTGEDSVEVRVGLLSTLKTTVPYDLEKARDNEMMEGRSVQPHSLPHYPIPPCLVGRKRKYPPPKSVYAVRDFPSGCGCSSFQQFGEGEKEHLGQDKADASSLKVTVMNDEHQAKVDYDADIASEEVMGITSGTIKDKHEGQSAEGAYGVMISMSQYDKSSEIKGQEQDSQVRMACGENEKEMVIVLCLMSAPSCPWKRGKEVKSIRSPTDAKRKEVSMSKNSKLREGCCMDDISGGKETIPVCVVNTLDDEKPPSFTYITSMMYPDYCQPMPPRGCDCKDDCLDSEHCACALNNEGKIPYNYDGEIVETKSLLYECGPLCKCRSSCHNRVSQYGIKFPLEIFKTKSRGWGVRCTSSIPLGGFICEYIGELLDDKEAEKRAVSDEYLFDIGRNYNDTSSNSVEIVGNVGFTIDAATYGNIGRFINRSCSPNLYAQDVVYDHDDRRIPHIILFATEHIPPMQELTYGYKYVNDQVRDSNGNIKIKNCYCGSSKCTKRMY